MCWELLETEGIFPWAKRGVPPPLERFTAMAARLAPLVTEAALLGYHLCYADLGHRHMKVPEDLGLCVRMARLAVEH